jgi:hypothetical protein
MKDDLLGAVCAHVREAFPGADVEVLHFDSGLVRNLPDLVVVQVARARGREPRAPERARGREPRAPEDGRAVVYVSAGASAEPMEEGFGLEFFLVAREPDPQAPRLVAMVAQLHGDPRYPLSLGQVIEIGHPWLPGASCDHLLVSLPGPFGEDFEWLRLGERTVRFVWLVPITRGEAELARSQGLVALQERLGAAGVDVAARVREAVV